MPFFQRKKKAYLNLERGRKSEYNRQYYILNCERVKARSRTLTKHSPIRKRQPSDFPKEPSLIRKRWPSEIPNRSHLEICNRLQISQIVEPSHKKVVTVLGRNRKTHCELFLGYKPNIHMLDMYSIARACAYDAFKWP